MGQVIDLFVLYQLIKKIATPFENTQAFKLGLIDKKGKRLKKATSVEEKKAMTYLDRFVFNIKRVMGKANLDNKLATFAGALFMLKESNSEMKRMPSDQEIIDGINEEMQYLSEATLKEFDEFISEDAPTNAGGPAIAGMGPEGVHWRDNGPDGILRRGRPRSRGKAIDGISYLKRMNKRRVANTQSRLARK
jgi:hypothetical protein